MKIEIENSNQRHVLIENVTVDTGTGTLKLDVSWKDSWRDPPAHGSDSTARHNWDAVWLFAKIRTRREMILTDSAASPNDVSFGVEEEDAVEVVPRGLRSAIGKFLGRSLDDNVLLPSEILGHEDPPFPFDIAIDIERHVRGGEPAHRATDNVSVRASQDGGKTVQTLVKTTPWLPLHMSENPSDYESPDSGGRQPRIVPVEGGLGVFIHRSEHQVGRGTVHYESLRIPCPELKSISSEEDIGVWVMGLEMVYVSPGAYHLGDPSVDATESSDVPKNGFYTKQSGHKTTYFVQSEEAIVAKDPDRAQPGDLTWTSPAPGSTWGDIPREFPKGYQAFYCMKRQITQGEYTDFINTLGGLGQAITARYPYGGEGNHRFEIYRSESARVALRPLRACNWLSWADGIAYAWWAGLRPMTELEFEKACRGPTEPVAGEYAWGSAEFKAARVILGPEEGQRIAVTGNANLGNESRPLRGGDGGMGPVCDDAFGTKVYPPARGAFGAAVERKGILSRERTGASYYGVMGLTGNLWEFAVNVCTTDGRAFTGEPGQGVLYIAGTLGTLDANGEYITPATTAWPSPQSSGAGFRGGSWYTVAARGRVADRAFAGSMLGYTVRSMDCGMRCVRTAPDCEQESSS